MKLKNLRFIILAIFFVILVGCGSSSPSGGNPSPNTPDNGGRLIPPKQDGGGTGAEEVPYSLMNEKEELLKNSGYLSAKKPEIDKDFEYNPNSMLPLPYPTDPPDSPDTPHTPAPDSDDTPSPPSPPPILIIKSTSVDGINGIKVEYDAIKFKELSEDKELSEVMLNVGEKVHLDFKKAYSLKEIKFLRITNEGSIYFVDDMRAGEDKQQYKIKSDFDNYGKLYVIDGNKSSELTIEGYYTGHNNSELYLGIYVTPDGGNLTTDQLKITKNVLGNTKVNFIYNDEKIKNIAKDTKTSSPVIEVLGKADAGQDTFFLGTLNGVPVGTGVFELNYKGNGTEKGHEWHLKKKK